MRRRWRASRRRRKCSATAPRSFWNSGAAVGGETNSFVAARPLGDAAYAEADGQPVPMMAPVAVQMAETAAANIARRLRGEEPVPFRYRDPGALATIGRNAAVAYIHGVAFKGFASSLGWCG